MKNNFKTRLLWVFLAGLLAIPISISGCGVKPAATTQPFTPPATADLTDIPSSLPPSSTSPGTVQPASPSSSASPDNTASNPASSTLAISGTEAEAILASIREGAVSVSSYRLNRNIEQEVSSPGTTTQGTYRIYSQFVMNVPNRILEMTNAINLKQPVGQPSWPMIENAIFIKDDYMYIQGLFPDDPQAWKKTPLTTEAWQMYNQAEFLISFVKPGSISGIYNVIEKSGSSSNNEILVEINPDSSELWSFIVNQPGIQLPKAPPEHVSYDSFMKSTGFKIWFDRKTGLPQRVVAGIDVEIKPDIMPSLKNSFLSSVKVNLSFSEYNLPVSIVIPSEALQSDELSLQKAE